VDFVINFGRKLIPIEVKYKELKKSEMQGSDCFVYLAFLIKFL